MGSRRWLLALLLFLLVAPGAASEDEPAARDTPAWWLGRAEAITEQVTVPAARASLLVSIGSGWIEAGGLEAARPLLAGAVEFGTKCKGCLSKAQRLAQIALLQHQAGDEMGSGRTFEIARKACDEVDGALHVQAMAYLAQLRQEAGEEMIGRVIFADAAKAAEALDGLDRVEALAAISDAHAAVGNLQASASVQRRLQLLARKQGLLGKMILASTLMNGAAAMMEAGRFAAAEKALSFVEVWPLAAPGYASLARARHEAGDAEGASKSLGRALEIASNLEDPMQQIEAYAGIARTAGVIQSEVGSAMARAGIGDALPRITGLEANIRALVAMADARRSAGESPAAARILDEVERLMESEALDAEGRDSLRAAVAGAETRAGRFPQAEKRTATIEDPIRRVRAELHLGEAYQRAGKDAEALSVCARQIAGMAGWDEALAADRAESMRQAARLQAACGRLEDAAKTVSRIDRPFHAATACVYIASDLTPE